MKVDGQCHCGSIRFEAEVEPDEVILCHCLDCQQLTGTAFRVVVPTRPGTFRLLAGSPKLYVKTADSGTKRVQTFCPDCGTPISSTLQSPGTQSLYLRVGALRQRDLMVPTLQLWTRSAQSWLPGISELPRHERQPDPAPDGSFRA